jgi:hypothetical protein
MRRNVLTASMLLLLLGVVARPGEEDDRAGANVNPPFRVGERSQFRASWGVLGRVGTGTLGIVSLDTVRGHPTYHAVFTIRGGIPGARVDERMETWLDQRRLFSHRFLQRTRYPRFSRDRTREFLAAERRWTGRTNTREESGVLPTSLPLDEIGFIYHARTMDLEVGREYTIDRFWNPEGNPVRLRVLRYEVVRVPAGTYQTIVVQPIIRTSGLFAEDGEAEVYFAEGPARELVQLRAKLSIGRLRLQLEKYEPGGS